MTVHPLRPPDSRKVHRASELSEVEEIRLVAISASHATALEVLGLRLCELGAPDNGAMCLALAAAWKVGSAA